MEPMKNLCGLIPESLHKRLIEGKSPEMTNGEYLTKILTTYLDQPATAKQEQRTLAVQISDDMFQRLARNRSRVRSFRTTRKNGRWPLLCPNLFSTALSSMWRRIMAYPNESSLWGWWHRNSNLG